MLPDGVQTAPAGHCVHNGYRREEDLTMGDPEPRAGDSDNAVNGQSEGLDAAREAALIQDVIRAQERHREGGIEPELDNAEAEPDAGT